MVDPADQLSHGELKGKCLNKILGLPFHRLDRRLRRVVVAMDGTTILDYQGNLLAVGAIVKVESGSEGGARLAGTKALSEYGLAIKISHDGGIRGFK